MHAQDDANPTFRLAARACPLGIARFVPREKILFSLYNKSLLTKFAESGWLSICPIPSHLDLRLGQERIHTFFFSLQAMKQRTRAMGFLKTIFEDGVDCILTPGEYVDAGIARERSNAGYVINAFSSSIITV